MKLVLLTIFISAIAIDSVNSQTMTKDVAEAKGLAVGDYVNNFTALDLNDSLFELNGALKKGPIVVIFYRGQWCPICNRHLSNLQDSLQMIYDKGAQVIAISPEKSEFLKRTAEKTHASFKLLFDDGYKISQQFDVLFLPDKLKRAAYNTLLGANLKESQSDDSEQLPIPATFIIDTNSKIVWRHFDPDYKKRSTVEDILKNIPKKIDK